MKKLCFIILLFPTLTLAQFTGKGNRTVGIDFMQGFILKHKKQISHLITAHPTGIRISIDRKTYGAKTWQQRYNYPDVGLSFYYINYHNKKLGQSIALIPHYNIYFTKNQQAKSQWKYQIGLGIGYNTEKYDRVENNKNNVLGSDLNFGIALQIQNEFAFTERIKLNSSLALTHFSNGSIKKPNSGINTVSFNAGLSYVFDYEKREYNYFDSDPIDKSGLGYTATFTFGMHEATKIRSGSKPFFVVSGLVDKTLNHKSKIGLGLDWFYSTSLKSDIKYDDELVGKNKPDFNRIGLAISHELRLDKFSMMTQVGYYIYDPYKAFTPYYLRAGLRRYFKSKMFASLCVKSHAAKAEAAEFAIGYRFK